MIKHRLHILASLLPAPLLLLTACNLPASSGKATTHNAAGHYKNVDMARTPEGLDDQTVNYEGFRLSFNASNHTPNWVAWELLGDETDGASTRTNKFWTDAGVRGCPDTKDYTKSGYDRGHMCPAADQKWSAEAMEDCFSLTNIVPQAHALNAGAWKTLEEKCRLWVQRDSALVIIAGPIYEPTDTQCIGNTGVRVPGAFFKAIVAPYLDQPRGIAFIYPNMRAPGNMKDYVVTIDDVEKLTGLDLFYNLPDDIEQKVESESFFNVWNRQ